MQLQVVIRHNISRFMLNRHTSSRDQAGSLDHCMNCANTLIGSGTDDHQRKQMHHLLVSRHEHATYIKVVLSFRTLLQYALQVFTFMTHHKIMALQSVSLLYAQWSSIRSIIHTRLAHMALQSVSLLYAQWSSIRSIIRTRLAQTHWYMCRNSLAHA